MFHEQPQRISHPVREVHTQRVLIDQRGVAQPIGNGISLDAGLNDESRVAVKVQATNNGQQAVAVSKEHRKTIGLQTLNLQQVACGLYLLESQHHDIVRIEMGIWYAQDVVDVQRIAPDGVLADIRLARRNKCIVRESQHLTLLRELKVAISILQGIHTIFARSHTLDDKMTSLIST